MDEIHYLVIVSLVAYAGIRIALWWGNRWKKRARHAYMVIGQHGQSNEEREWGYRNALLAGEQKAEKFYLCAALEKFMEEKPLTPYPFDDGLGGTIPFVF